MSIDTAEIEGKLEGYTPPESDQDWGCVAALQTIRNLRLLLANATGYRSVLEKIANGVEQRQYDGSTVVMDHPDAMEIARTAIEAGMGRPD